MPRCREAIKKKARRARAITEVVARPTFGIATPRATTAGAGIPMCAHHAKSDRRPVRLNAGLARRSRIVAALIGLAGVGACTSVEETVPAPNALRLTTHATGDRAIGHAPGKTMQAAARTTLAHGHSHFKLREITLYNTSPAVGSALDVGVTVIMFDRSESRAFSAEDVLARRR